MASQRPRHAVIVPATPEAIDRAARLLHDGALVAFPTETVYGLGAAARNEKALRALYAAKGRPGEHPVIVHLALASAMARWARHVPSFAQTLADAFWPGPLTLVLPRADHVSPLVTGGQDSVGLRVPAHRVAHALLERFAALGGDGIAAPSANRFGRISATLAEHVDDEFGADVALILDAGACDFGIESTIVDCTGEHPALLRPGAIALGELSRVLGRVPDEPGCGAPRASGTLAAHYAPRTPARLVAPGALAHLGVETPRAPTTAIAVLARSVDRPATFDGHWHIAPADAAGYAHDLYAQLRALDAMGAREIWIEAPPATPEWAAVRDRLQRATHDTGL